MQRVRIKSTFLLVVVWLIAVIEATSQDPNYFGVSPIIQYSNIQPNNYHFQPNYVQQQQPNYAQQHPSNNAEHFYVTAVKTNPQPQVHYQPANHKQEASFNGQSFVIEPSYLLKPYKAENHQNNNGYHAQQYQPHQVYQAPVQHQGPAYQIPPYQSPVYQTPVLPQPHPFQSSIYQPQLYTSVALLAPYSASSHQTGFYHHQQPSRLVHQIQDYAQALPTPAAAVQLASPVQPIRVEETAKPQVAIEQSVDFLFTDPNDQDKRYIPETGFQVKEVAQSKNEDPVKAADDPVKLINQHVQDSSNRIAPVKLTDLVYPPKTEIANLEESVTSGKAAAIPYDEEIVAPVEEVDSANDKSSIASSALSVDSRIEQDDKSATEFPLGEERVEEQVTQSDQNVDEVEAIVDQVLGVEHKSSDDIEQSDDVKPVEIAEEPIESVAGLNATLEVNQVNQTTVDKEADLSNEDVQQDRPHETTDSSIVTQTTPKLEPKEEPSVKSDTGRNTEVADYDSIFDEPMTREELQFFTPFDAQKIPAGEDLVVDKPKTLIDSIKSVEPEDNQEVKEQVPIEQENVADDDAEVEAVPYHRFRLAGIKRKEKVVPKIEPVNQEDEVSVFDQEDLVRATKETKEGESDYEPKPFYQLQHKEEKFQVPFSQLKSLVASAEQEDETDKAVVQDVLFYSQVSQAGLASKKDNTELYFSSTKDTTLEAEQVEEKNVDDAQPQSVSPFLDVNVPSVEQVERNQEETVQTELKDSIELAQSTRADEDQVTEADPEYVSPVPKTIDSTLTADELVLDDKVENVQEKFQETPVAHSKKQETTENYESVTEEEQVVADIKTVVEPTFEPNVEKDEEAEAVPEIPTSQLPPTVKYDLNVEEPVQDSNQDEVDQPAPIVNQDVVTEEVSLSYKDQETVTETAEIPSSTGKYQDKEESVDSVPSQDEPPKPETPVEIESEPTVNNKSEEYVAQTEPVDDHPVPCTKAKEESSVVVEEPLVKAKEESSVRPELHFNTAALANIPFENYESEEVEEVTTYAPSDLSSPISVSTDSALNETTTTSSPVETEVKKTTRAPGRFYTGRANKQSSTTSKPTTTAQLVVIGKAAEVRKPINGKLYARVSSVPQNKPPALPKVKILPSRLRLPSANQRVKDQKADRRYFVGRPPVADRNPEEEMEELEAME